MATEASPRTAIVNAVVTKAKFERNKNNTFSHEADRLHRQAVESKEEADAAREAWEQCIDWLDENVPEWETTMPESEVQLIRTGKTSG